MVAAQDDGECARRQDFLHPMLDIGVALDRIGVDDVGVANVDDADITAEIGGIVLVIVCPGVTK